MTIKFGNFANFIVRNFVVIWEAPKEGLCEGCGEGSWEGFFLKGGPQRVVQ